MRDSPVGLPALFALALCILSDGDRPMRIPRVSRARSFRKLVFPMILSVLLSASAGRAGQVVIPAANMSDKDRRVVPANEKWSGLSVCNGEGGFKQWTAKISKAGPHYIHFRYASGQPRPCVLTVGGKVVGKSVLGQTTGGFYGSALKWGTCGPFDLVKGANTIRLSAGGHMPHFLGLVVSTDKTPPKASVLPKPKVTARSPRRGKRPAAPPVPLKEVDPQTVAANRQAVRGLLGETDKVVFIKRNSYTSNHYYTEYLNSRWLPGGNLCVLSLADGSVRDILPEMTGGVFGRFDLSFDARRIVFCYKKAELEGYRIYEVNVDGTSLRQLTFPPADEAELIKKYKLSRGYHHGTDDMHPCYLPDGGIAFISTRCQYGILCNGPDDFTTTVLYRMDGDGKNMRKLTNSSVSEAAPALLEDGRVLYTRWEYFDKGAVSVKCLWAMNPDGSGSAEVYGATLSLPPTLIFGRPIPDQAGKYVVCGTPHYPQAGVGTVIRLDMSRPIRTRDPMTYMTPYVDIRGEGGFAFRDGDGPWKNDRSGRGPLFRDPLPLSEKHFLVAHKPAGPAWTDSTSYDLYLLDETGKVSLFYRDKAISCWQPMPLRPRKRPPVLPTVLNKDLAAKNQAVCVVTDVYHGMEGITRGEAKYIRILEQIPRFWSARRRWGGDGYDQQHVCITKDTHLALKVQHGVVPIEADGSAHFVVPAKGNISFQVLDANYMSIQTERTYVNYMPGERRACIGCHETPQTAATVKPARGTLALKRPPSVPGPQPGETVGARSLHYPSDVQPVLDKHCVKCHSGEKPKGDLDLTGELTVRFSRSYENLIPERRRGKGRRRFELVGPTIGENHPKTGISSYYPGGSSVKYMPPKAIGSHASVLVAMHSKGKVKLANPEHAKIAAELAEKHKKINLPPADLLKITNWVDTNAQYYGSWWGRRNLQYKDHPNFRPVPTFAQAISTIPPLPEDKR